MSMHARFTLLVLCVGLTGCGASIPGLSTGSLFGGDSATPAIPPQVTNDPTSRAMQVGTTAARALKCGYNFDPVKLRTQFLAAEAPGLTNPADADKVARVYDVSFSGVSKAVAGQGEGYCSANKTGKIKEALNRHLTGDYTPSPPEPVVTEDGGLFGDVGATSGGEYKDSNPWKRD
ncbi:MAG: hypothetical protein ABL897_09215 [Hyphomicrobium sp.]